MLSSSAAIRAQSARVIAAGTSARELLDGLFIKDMNGWTN
ncbi:hypothetical protein BF49_5515 [Bradyrhizobium sp.]|nr:hypothetical protein BF49_5515 [Bradyrhizobium sp.]